MPSTRNFARATAASALALGLALASPSFAEETDANTIVVTGQAKIGDFGLDLTARDTAADPGEDFERYASGAWIDRTEIPDDRPSVGSFYNLREDVTEEVNGLITQAPAGTQYGALYTSFMNEAAIERAGLAPLMRDLAQVDALSDKSAFARYMGATYGKFGGSLFGAGPYADPDDPTMNALWMFSGGLGLPEKEYYFDAKFADQRGAYLAYLERTFRHIGEASPREAASRVMTFETYVAQLNWDAEQKRQIEKINNPMSGSELAAYAPGMDWDAFFAGHNIPPQERIIVTDNTAVKAIAALFASTDLATLKLWQKAQVTHQASPYLNQKMVESRFQYTSALNGTSEQRARWKRAVDTIDGSLGELVGEAYVDEYFPKIAKTRMDELVTNLKLAMGDRIGENDWMSPETKEAALDKLERMDVMVGYPEKFRDYSQLPMSPDDLYGNMIAASQFNADYEMGDLGKPVDRKKWGMNPQTVNAYNGGLENKMVFPAGILQPPFFDPWADPAVNYGAIGVVIGHEISHGFDDQGRKIDASGAIRDWWTVGDAERFEAEAKKFGAQYAAFEVVPGSFINPDLTMGENIADLAGVLVAHDAYKKSLGGEEAPVIDGLTGDQRFFLAYAQVWRAKAREDSLRNQVATDPHSPARYRTIAPLRNVDAWYEAFGITPDDAMYIAPEDRARIW
ncbi:MAG: M13 family metallopeptidase [Erythrobacter sp.]|jgi:putative endopeptidase|uniref:M13 family metallopeptidase n=1 Tax=Qipengyuania citrea TaxID=225971 RepID=UPI000BDBD1D2|nr:M13 family metallopeptidase [Qipengyuania citrea]MBL4718843.1 M13 family metallopeptidase [Erythrobacter sp.]MCP2016148.1 putative endopeptidase [Qipengyuania citrea]MDE0900220.1 M13 family metallopeptidase [Erythrobacter sp.]PCH76487.1 MAG: peptidase M13 [Erythrobacteraceae bacterium]